MDFNSKIITMSNLKIFGYNQENISIYDHQTKKKYHINKSTHLIHSFQYNKNNFFDINFNEYITNSNLIFSIDSINYCIVPPKTPSIMTLNINTSKFLIDVIDKSEFDTKKPICQKNTDTNYQPLIKLNMNNNLIEFKYWFGDGLIKTSLSRDGSIASIIFGSDLVTLCIRTPEIIGCSKKSFIISSVFRYQQLPNEINQYDCDKLRPNFTHGSIINNHILLSKNCCFSLNTLNTINIPLQTIYL